MSIIDSIGTACRRLPASLFSTHRDSELAPVQVRVTLIALYSIVIVSLLAAPYNIVMDLREEEFFLAFTQILYLGILISGLISFWYSGQVRAIRSSFTVAVFILIAGIGVGGGGVRGLGFLYIIGSYGVLFLILGRLGAMIVPALVFLAALLNVVFANYGPLSYLNDPEFALRYLIIIGASSSLGVATAHYQHQIFRFFYHLAYTDETTGLANRSRFEARLEREILKQHRLEFPGFSLVGLKLLDFARINTFHGSEYGDALLSELAYRIQTLCGSHGVPSRYSGTVFLCLVPWTEPYELEDFGRKLVESVQRTFSRGTQSVSVQALASVTIYPKDGESGAKLIANLMGSFVHLRDYPGFVSFFDENLYRLEAHRYAVVQQLRGAIENQELTLRFQPKLLVEDGSCRGAEVLLRWKNSILGDIGPDVFIPLAEQAGFINDITRWVIRTAVNAVERVYRELTADVLGHGFVHAINLSPLDLGDPDFPDFIAGILENTDLPAGALEFEITEGVMMDDNPAIQRSLECIRENRFRLAIDDFGTGYSSLSYLHRLRIQNLKIDKSFVAGLSEENPDSPVIDAMLAMARSLNVETTAEGIETEFQQDYLNERGCTFGQGWLYAKPLDTEAYIVWLKEKARSGN